MQNQTSIPIVLKAIIMMAPFVATCGMIRLYSARDLVGALLGILIELFLMGKEAAEISAHGNIVDMLTKSLLLQGNSFYAVFMIPLVLIPNEQRPPISPWLYGIAIITALSLSGLSRLYNWPYMIIFSFPPVAIWEPLSFVPSVILVYIHKVLTLVFALRSGWLWIRGFLLPRYPSLINYLPESLAKFVITHAKPMSNGRNRRALHEPDFFEPEYRPLRLKRRAITRDEMDAIQALEILGNTRN